MEFMKKTLNYNLIFFAELQESEEDIKNGRVCTLEELKAEMEARYESYYNSKSQA